MTFKVKRRSAPLTVDELEDLRDVSVSVFTGTKKTERRTRSDYQHTYKPVIAIHKKLSGETPEAKEAEVAALENFTEEIEALFETDAADVLDWASLDSFEEEQERVSYNTEVLRDLDTFATQIVLMYIDG